MWLCDTETEVLLWLTGMWNYLQVYFTSCLFLGDKFYCLDMLILVYKNLSDEVNKSCALQIMAKKKKKNKSWREPQRCKLDLTCYLLWRQHLISKSGLSGFSVWLLLNTLWKTHINAERSKFFLIQKAHLRRARTILHHTLGCWCWL